MSFRTQIMPFMKQNSVALMKTLVISRNESSRDGKIVTNTYVLECQ